MKERPTTEKELKKYLKLLVKSCELVIKEMDSEMKNPSTFNRGKIISKLMNYLEINKDMAKRFGLGDLS